MEKTVVIFTPNNARIIRNPSAEALESFVKWPNVVIDPDLSKVEGLPPHFWKLVDGEIVPLDAAEQTARQNHIEKFGVDNSTSSQVITLKKQRFTLHHIDYIYYSVIIFLLLVVILTILLK